MIPEKSFLTRAYFDTFSHQLCYDTTLKDSVIAILVKEVFKKQSLSDKVS